MLDFEKLEEKGNTTVKFCKCIQCKASKSKRHKPRKFFKRQLNKKIRTQYGKRISFFYA